MWNENVASPTIFLYRSICAIRIYLTEAFISTSISPNRRTMENVVTSYDTVFMILQHENNLIHVNCAIDNIHHTFAAYRTFAWLSPDIDDSRSF